MYLVFFLGGGGTVQQTPLINFTKVTRRRKCRKKSQSWANFLHKDNGLLWKRRGKGEHAHTNGHAHTDSPLAVWDTADTAVWPIFSSSSGSGRTGPRYRDLLQQHKLRPRPPSELMSGRKFFSQWWLRGAAGNSVHAPSRCDVTSSPPASCGRLKRKMRLSPLCRLDALLGSQGGGPLTLQAASQYIVITTVTSLHLFWKAVNFILEDFWCLLPSTSTLQLWQLQVKIYRRVYRFK